MKEIEPGTIAVLHKGSVLSELDDWLISQFETYPGQLYRSKPRGNQIPRMRNLAVEKMWGRWVLFVDSDCVPQPDALHRLVAHQLPIVGAKVAERWSPFSVAATHEDEEGRPRKYTIEDVPKTGLHKVLTLGMGCTLIRREVFEAVEPPWFRAGQIALDMLTEDTEFCLRAAKAGFSSHLDCDVQAGHQVEGILWPGKDGRRWVQWMGPTDHLEPLTVLGGSEPEAP